MIKLLFIILLFMKMDDISGVVKQFKYYKLLGESTMTQLSAQELLWQYNQESNSIAVIVKHLWGNMTSRWTDIWDSDGEKEWRDRDAEFVGDLMTRKAIIEKWDAGWKCLFESLDSIQHDNIDQPIYIRNMGHSVAEAIQRQLAHYAYHIGQMVYIGRMIKGSQWKNLSIPKGQSKAFNQEKFSKEKHQEHFTDQFLKETS